MRLGSDAPIGQLEPFEVPPGQAGAETALVSEAGWDDGRLTYAGPGWVGGRLLHVESRRARAGYLLRVDGAGEFTVGAGGTAIGWRQPVDGARPSQEVMAAVLGPCVALALAQRGVWCLHASSAGTARSAVALTGDSGCGKSTLAAALAARSRAWRRVADDLFPVRLAGAGALALPRFPQPGLTPGLQWRRPVPDEVELTAVYVLEPGAAEVALRRLSSRGATEVLIRQTVAARLFAADLQARHLDFCARLVRRLPVSSLRFPRRLEALPAMTAAIFDEEAG